MYNTSGSPVDDTPYMAVAPASCALLTEYVPTPPKLPVSWPVMYVSGGDIVPLITVPIMIVPLMILVTVNVVPAVTNEPTNSTETSIKFDEYNPPRLTFSKTKTQRIYF